MATIVTVKFFPKLDNVEEVKEWFKNNLYTTEKYEGCQLIRAAYNKDINEFLLYEIWDSEDAHKKYVNWRVEVGDIPMLAGLSTKDPEITYLEEVY